MTTLDDISEEVVDLHRYGNFVFYHEGWAYWDSSETSNYLLNKLETHACTPQELGLDSDSQFPIDSDYRNLVLKWSKKFKCVDDTDYVVWGNYNTGHANTFVIGFTLCEGFDYCHDHKTTMEWLDDKYIVLMFQESRFNH